MTNSERSELPVQSLEALRRRRSVKWRTYPSDVIPLTVAEMDFDLAPVVQAVLRDAVESSDTGYSMAVPDLGNALAGFAAARWDWELDPDNVTAVADVGVGVVELLRVLTGPQDAVVINPPVYPPFYTWAPEAGPSLIEVPLVHDADRWHLDLHGLERAFADHPAVFLLCNPHNPVGAVHTRDELEAVVRLAQAYQVTIISDEIHGPLVLAGARHNPILSVAGAADVAISVLSASKAWNLAGLKCAAVVTASPRMEAVTAKLPPDTRWRVGHLGVLASVAALTEGVDWLDDLLVTLDHRRTLLTQLLDIRLPLASWTPPQATFLAWIDCSGLAGDDARTRFLDQGRVAVEPGLRFGTASSRHVRLNFATSSEILTEAVERMASAVG